MKTPTFSASVALAVLALVGTPGHAQDVAGFYRGKTVNLYIGYTTGGGYDVYARAIARHMSRHLPGNPSVVPRNMEGAGSMRMANWLYNVAPKDGATFGTFSRGLAFDPLLGLPGAQFDAPKFGWIGSANNEVSLCASWRSSGVNTFDDLMTKELIVGGTGPGADADLYPRVINGVLGTKFKLITGYPGGNDISLAMLRKEVDGRCGWSWSTAKSTQPQWLKDNLVSLLVQLSLEKHSELPDVPLIMDLAKTDEQKQILKLIFVRQMMGRPYATPPGVPPDRVAALRKALADTLRDPAFLAEADKMQLEINAVSGEAIQATVQEGYATPADIARKAAALLK